MNINIERINPFQKIYVKCNKGNLKKKLLELSDFPELIDIELTNKCNFKCLMCPTGTRQVERKKGFMSDETFFSILNQIKSYKPSVRFVRWGEPLLHPKILEYIKELKKIGSLVHINTNGLLLTEDRMDDLLEAELDSIKFSFQGIDQKSYAEMRNIDFFDKLLKTVEIFYNKRSNRHKPFIQVSTSITYETLEQVQSFKERISRYCDFVNVGRTVLDRIDIEKIKLSQKEQKVLIDLKKQESVVKKHFECFEVFDKLSINWDGTVSACCADFDNKMLVGNLNEQSLKEIWKSNKINAYRVLLANMEHDKIKLCSTCYDFQGIVYPGIQKTDCKNA